MPSEFRFAGYPTALVREKPSTAKSAKVLKQLIWGDFVSVTGDPVDGFVPVRVRGVEGFIDEDQLQDEQLLELIFVDIGQGDGCLMITPDNRILVIDAGEGDNMARFLRWRFRGFKKSIEFEAAILSHSDMDHYGGFANLFAQENLSFKNVYTNGFMERKAESDSDVLGPRVAHDGEKYITDLVPDLPSLKAFFRKPAQFERKKYPTMLKKALDAGKFKNFRMLSAQDEFVPGFSPADGELRMELLGPIVEKVDGKPALRWFEAPGPTKNGHSVVIRLQYRDISVIAGGDLNIPSESLLLGFHSGAEKTPTTEKQRQAAAVKARKKLSADFAKACHHGSADVSPAFLSAIHPLATVISSGDAESFSHPRADTLGLIGKHSRGERPAIFSTELARSAPERIKDARKLRAQLDEVIAKVQTELTEAERKKVDETIAELKKNLERSVTTYGAINLRTDGRKAIIAQKVEEPRDTKSQWDVYKFERDAASGELALISKHAD